MKCLYQKNPGCGFVSEHTGVYCANEHNPRILASFHVYLGNWCGNVCWWCKDRLVKSHSHARVDEIDLRPWKQETT